MRLRSFLLVGSALPLAITTPTFATQPGHLLQLAQQEVCPEGQECPQAGGEKPKPHKRQGGGQGQNQQQQGGAQGGEPPAGQATEQGAQEGTDQGGGQNQGQRRQRQRHQQQQGGGEQGGGQQGDEQGGEPPAQGGEPPPVQGSEPPPVQGAEPPPVEGGEPPPTLGAEQGGGQQGEQGGGQGKRHRQRQHQQQGGDQGGQQGGGQQGGEPPPDVSGDQGGGQQGGDQGQRKHNRQHQQGGGQGGQQDGGQQGGQGGNTDDNGPPPESTPPDLGEAQPPEESTTEQQLDRQGDSEEANTVRTLRQRLRQQLENTIGIAPEEGGQRDNNRRRDRRRDDRGWQNRDQDRDVIDRRGGRIVIDLGNGNLSVEQVAPDEGGRLLYGADDVEVQNLPRGRTRTIVHRRNGVDIVTVRDRNGDIVKRSKILPNGTEIVLIDNRFPEGYEDNPPPPPILIDVPPPVIGIPENRYIVDYGDASDEDIRGALVAPPVQRIQRPYTLDEVLQNQEVRAYSPRIDLDTITFDTGSATIGEDQMNSLYALGHAMEQVIADSPDEVYLIEGHTDAVGKPNDNLILSDERAEAVAAALSQNFDIPPENLVTKGYGEEFLKVGTDGPEQRNRRATIRRLTELLQAQNQ